MSIDKDFAGCIYLIVMGYGFELVSLPIVIVIMDSSCCFTCHKWGMVLPSSDFYLCPEFCR